MQALRSTQTELAAGGVVPTIPPSSGSVDAVHVEFPQFEFGFGGSISGLLSLIRAIQ